VASVALASVWLVVSLFLTWSSLQEEHHLDKVGVVATGTVREVHTRRLDPWPTVDVSLQTPQGPRATTVGGGFFAYYDVGQKLRVQYNPHKLGEARLAGSRADLWAHLTNAVLLAPVVCLGVGALLWVPVANRLRPVPGRHTRRPGSMLRRESGG
jgi:hypothetical protein